MARLLLLSEHSRKVFETRVDPLVKFDKEKFHSRYRLSKEVVLDLAEDFGRSRFASKGKGRGGGISNQLKVRVGEAGAQWIMGHSGSEPRSGML